MTTRAHHSLNAATKHFNSRYKWSFLETEATPISVVGPIGFTAVVSAGETSAFFGSTPGITANDFLVGGPYQVGTRITAFEYSTAIGSGSFGFDRAAVSGNGVTPMSATAVRDLYDLPTDWKQAYSVRLLGAKTTLYPAIRRVYDRSLGDEFASSSPSSYDIFGVGQYSKIRLLPPPSGSDTLLLRYYRRMATQSVSATAQTLDIPLDYDQYLIAWAKWHFLTDKGENYQAQSRTWLAFAQEGLVTMLREQTALPDQDVAIIYGGGILNYSGNDASTRHIAWEQG